MFRSVSAPDSDHSQQRMVAPARSAVARLGSEPLYLRATWALLLVLALFPVLASILDLVNVGANGIPSDHRAAFGAVAGMDWSAARSAAAGVARYVSPMSATH
jgi:hypothetical protein